MIGREYLDSGDRMSGRHDPPRRCQVVTRWGRGGRRETSQCDIWTTALWPWCCSRGGSGGQQPSGGPVTAESNKLLAARAQELAKGADGLQLTEPAAS